MTQFRAGAASHVGQIRSNNQDSLLVADSLSLFAVADGMGGHQGGEVASQIAVETLESIVSEPTHESIVEAVKEANRRIFAHADDQSELRGMGTTLVGIVLVNQGLPDEEMAWVNVGDSRVYLLRDNQLIQLSRDHSLVEDLRRGGQLTAEEAAVHPQRNILTRALGIDAEVEVDSAAFEPLQGDRYLLCSDGLFNEVDPDTIVTILSTIEDPDAAAEELVRLANEGGGRDNITVVIVDVTDDDGRAARAAELAATAAANLAADKAAAEAAGEAPGPDTDPTLQTGPPDAPAAGDAGPDADATPPAGLPVPPPPPAAPDEPAADPTTGDGAAEVAPAPIAAGASAYPLDDEDAAAQAAADDDLPFGRTTGDVFDDLESAGSRHKVTRIATIVVIVAILAATVLFAIRFYDRSGWYVQATDGTAEVFRGRADGTILFPAEAVGSVSADVDSMVPADAADIVEPKEFNSRAEAESFINNSVTAAAQDAASQDDTPATTAPTTEAEDPAPTTADAPGATDNPATTDPGTSAPTSGGGSADGG